MSLACACAALASVPLQLSAPAAAKRVLPHWRATARSALIRARTVAEAPATSLQPRLLVVPVLP